MASIALDKRFNIPGTYELFALSDDDTEALYEFTKAFWVERNQSLDQEEIDRVVAAYRVRSNELHRIHCAGRKHCAVSRAHRRARGNFRHFRIKVCEWSAHAVS